MMAPASRAIKTPILESARTRTRAKEVDVVVWMIMRRKSRCLGSFNLGNDGHYEGVKFHEFRLQDFPASFSIEIANAAIKIVALKCGKSVFTLSSGNTYYMELCILACKSSSPFLSRDRSWMNRFTIK